MARDTADLNDAKLPVELKLSALWASLMLCYIYGDYFGLYKPGKLQGMLDGKMGSLRPITQEVLLGTAILMAMPALMVCLSVLLKTSVNRWVNIVLGSIYAVIMLITMPGAWAFYVFLGIVEVALTAIIVWTAWSWPRQRGS